MNNKQNRYIAIASVFALLLTLSVPAAGFEGEDMYYEMGAGDSWSRPASDGVTIGYGLGASWNASAGCDGFDFGFSLQNQINGITGQLQDTMSSLIYSATGAIASLPGHILQRLNPGLYDTITNGVFQAGEEFHLAEMTCEQMTEKMGDFVMSHKWTDVATGQFWDTQKDVPNTDILNVKEDAREDGGDAGVTWVGGDKAGGDGQDPILIVADTGTAGYNSLQNRALNETSTVASCTDPICEYWDDPAAMTAWLVEVLGEKAIRTCDGCDEVDANPGKGLTVAVEEERQKIATNIADMVSGTSAVNPTNLAAASGGPNMRLVRGLIIALREEPPAVAGTMISKLSSEMALARTVEMAMLARRVLLAGKRESNIANLEVAQDDIAGYVSELEREIDNILYELEVRKKVSGNAASALLRRHQGRYSTVHIREEPPVTSFAGGARLGP